MNQSESKSEAARVLHQIDLKRETTAPARHGYAITTQHDFINAGIRIGQIISYSSPNRGHIAYGTIMHLGLGPTTRNALWVRCLDGLNKGKVEYLMRENVIGVIANAS